MQTFHAATVAEKDGRLHLDHVPFPEGAAVQVWVAAVPPTPAAAGLMPDQSPVPEAFGLWKNNPRDALAYEPQPRAEALADLMAIGPVDLPPRQ